jgi:ferredoxin
MLTTPFTVHLLRPGQAPASFDAPADMPVLLAAERAGLAMESSCRNGTCRSCIALLAQGQVTYRIEWPGVSPDERREGWFLPCAAYPASDLVVELPL